MKFYLYKGSKYTAEQLYNKLSIMPLEEMMKEFNGIRKLNPNDADLYPSI